jgi:protocatechuate 3,4-dioxygenase beta subunit
MKLLATSLLGLLLAHAALRAQSGPSASASASTRAAIAGVVTKDPTGEPVKKALIELIAENQNEGGDYTAVTGTDGNFRIEGIAPGRYHLFAERTGYLEADKRHARTDGRVLTLVAGQEVKDLLIRMQSAAVVEGRVTDEDGDPLPNAEVAVSRQTYASGHSRWEQAGAERTNDLGEYRVAGLAAGTYYISVTPPPDFKSLIESASKVPTKSAATEKTATSYQTTFYPGTRDRVQAEPVQLHAGDDFPANFSLTMSPSLAIRGTLANIPAGSSAMVMLQSRDFNVAVNGGEMRRDGSFEIRDVSPGTYTLVASVTDGPAPLTARQTVQLTAENVEGLRLSPQPGGTIRGHIRVEGARAGSDRNAMNADPRQFFLSLHSADGDDDVLGALSLGNGFASLAHVSADGSIEWRNVPAGKYFVQLAGESVTPEWFLKSANAGGVDANENGISVSGGMITLDLLASANGAVIDGVVATAKGEPATNVTVVAVPEPRLRLRTDRYRKTISDQSGHFSLRALPPGEYTIYAWENVDGDAYYSADFLKMYEGQGSALHVSEGEHKSVQLAVIPAAEEQ